MPKPPENIEREVTCPNCATSRTTKAQPNTNLRCRHCGQLFKVPRPGEAPPPGGEAPPPDPPREDPPNSPPGQPSSGRGRVTPVVRPADPPPPGGQPGDDATEDPESGGGLETPPGPSGGQPGDPPPEPGDPPPEEEDTPPPPRPRGAKRWRRT